MLLVPIPLGTSSVGITILTVLSPNTRYHKQRKSSTEATDEDWSRQNGTANCGVDATTRVIVVVIAILVLPWRLWGALPNRPVHIIYSLAFGSLNSINPAPPRRPKQIGRPRKVGNDCLARKRLWITLTPPADES